MSDPDDLEFEAAWEGDVEAITAAWAEHVAGCAGCEQCQPDRRRR